LLRDTTFVQIGISNFEWKLVKNLVNWQYLPFTETWRHSKLASRSCKNHWEKHLWAFVKVVEDSEIYKFGRCTSVQIFGINLGQTRLHRNVSHWNATSRRPCPPAHAARRTVALAPGPHAAEAALLPKASHIPRLPLRSAPPRGASAFDDRALARDHRSVRRSLHYASAPT
jgi:hypothetical protein